MTLLALAVAGRGLVDPDEPVVHADDEALLRGRAAFETVRVYGGVPVPARVAPRPARRLVRADRHRAARCRGVPRARVARARHGAASRTPRCASTARPDASAPASPGLLVLVSALPTTSRSCARAGSKLVSLLGVRAEAPWLLGGVKSTSYAVNMAAEAEARAARRRRRRLRHATTASCSKAR